MEDRNDLTIDLRRAVRVLLKKWWLVLLVSLLFAAILFTYTAYFTPNTYTAKTQMYVRNVIDAPNYEVNGITSGDWVAVTGLADTYRVILENEHSLRAIQRKTGLNYSLSALESMIYAYTLEETPVLEISVVCTNAQHAKAIADAATEVLSDYELPGTSTVTLYLAEVPTVANAKGTISKAMIGFAVGLVLCAIVLIVVDLKKDIIHSEDWLHESFGEKIPLLAIIPSANNGSSSGYGKYKRYNYYERYGYYASSQSKKDA